MLSRCGFVAYPCLPCLLCLPFRCVTVKQCRQQTHDAIARCDAGNGVPSCCLDKLFVQNQTGQRARPSCVELATAVCTSAAVGSYLAQQAALWQAASQVHSLSVQLEKAGMDATECGEVSEQLREVAMRYTL